MKLRAPLLLLLAGLALPRFAAQIAPAPDAAASRLASELLFVLADGGPRAASPALTRVENYLSGPVTGTATALRPLEDYFLWAAQLPHEDPRLARVAFLPGERLAGGLWYGTRAEAAGGLQLALTGEALIAIRQPGEAFTALRHDFTTNPLFTLPVAAGSEIWVLPLGGETARGPVAGVSAFDPSFPCVLAGFSAEALDDGHVRTLALHVETDGEQDIVRFDIERTSRPGAEWRVIAAVPATGGGDYHVIDSRFPGRAYYRLVPVLGSGLRGVPLAVIAAGAAPNKP